MNTHVDYAINIYENNHNYKYLRGNTNKWIKSTENGWIDVNKCDLNTLISSYDIKGTNNKINVINEWKMLAHDQYFNMMLIV